jgi:hypothetical protein
VTKIKAKTDTISFITPTTGVDDEPVVVAMATHSTLTANPTNVVADGTSTSTITMRYSYNYWW